MVNTTRVECDAVAQARLALMDTDTEKKIARVAALAQAMQSDAIGLSEHFVPRAPHEPGRPALPGLVDPRALERRSTATAIGRAALIHAVAHIEFNAINLALDAVCRFPGFPHAFYRDWLRVAAEEATHFQMLREHLVHLGYDYGTFPAHDGLWEMALKTAHDALARMALVPRVLEARGLDASPGIIRRLRAAGDHRGAEILEIILREEVGHVGIGSRWFKHLCAERGLDPDSTFERLLREYDAPRAVLPLNVEARRQAQFSDQELAYIETVARNRSLKRSH